MKFRFTIFNDSLAPDGVVVKTPIGWKECKLVLERHKDYHSLIEFFEGEFIFFGDAMDLLTAIETAEGPDARPIVVIEVSNQINVWEQVYSGIIDLSMLEEFAYGTAEYKIKIPIIRNDFWTKFINRKSVPVDLAASVDIDGNARTPIASTTIPMPSQAINAYYKAEMESANTTGRVPVEYNFNGSSLDSAGQIDLPIKKVQEVKNVSELPAMILNITGWGPSGNNSFAPNLVAKFKGTYVFEINMVMSTSPYSSPYAGGNKVASLALRIYLNGVLHDSASVSNLGVNGTDGRTIYNYSSTFDLNAGDSISYILALTGVITADYFIVFNDYFPGENSYITFEATTLFEDTECETFKIKDAAESILSKITAKDNVVESSALDSCYGKYSLQRGLQIRGYSLADKPFTMSFDDWWMGCNPILNLGLKYTEDDTIRIEKKSYFYNPSPSVSLSGVPNMVRTYDTDKFIKTVQIGYDKWSAESASGIDDPQTKRTWRTIFSSIGKDEKLLSKFIAASLAIEETRRQRIEESKDWRLDEEVFIIALNSDDEPELGTAFEAISNLLNADTRYNVRLSCARNFQRWLDYLSASLRHNIALEFEYSAGEGNTTMISELKTDDCENNGTVMATENGNEQQQTPLFLPKEFSFAYPLSWTNYKTIRDNAERAIGVNSKPHFIVRLEYPLTTGKASFKTLLAKDEVITGGIFDETFDETFE